MILFNYIASFVLITLGLYCIVVKYNLIKTVIGPLQHWIVGIFGYLVVNCQL